MMTAVNKKQIWEEEILDLLNSEESAWSDECWCRPTLSSSDAQDTDNQHEAVGSDLKQGVKSQQSNKSKKIEVTI